MKIAIFPNTSKDKELSVTREIMEFVKEKGHTPVLYIEGRFKNDACISAATLEFERVSTLAGTDCLITLGGDGTILAASVRAARDNVPILGINMGRLGYLTDVNVSKFKTALTALFEGNYKTEKRMMIRASVSDGGKILLNRTALNDIFIKESNLRVIDVSVNIDGAFFEKYFADGIIFSTPTGSTAYNLSAKGPVLSPDAKMLIVTPICPHSLYACPVVLPSSVEISVKCAGEATLICDGNIIFNLTDKHILTIRRHKHYTHIIKTNNLGFYDILRNKMIEKTVDRE